jgi:alkaline phosphatase
MVRDSHPDVMLGGGWLYFRPTGEDSVRTDDGLYDELDVAGYTRVDSADAAQRRGRGRAAAAVR